MTDCVKYNSDGKCTECGTSKFLMLTTGTISCATACVTTGTPNQNAAIYDNLDGRVRVCVSSAYIRTMAGEGSQSVSTNQCDTFARVGWANSFALVGNAANTLGASGEPAAGDYVCIKEYAYALGTGPDYSNVYFKAITKSRLIDSSIGLFSNQPYRFGSTGQTSPSLFGYNGLGFTPIAGHSSNANNTPDRVFFNANCAMYLKYDQAYIDSVGSVNPTPNTYLCNQCEFRYQLKLTCTISSASRCTTITPSCDNRTGDWTNTAYYSGLPAYLNAILSVHACPGQQSLVFQQQSTNYNPAAMDTTYVGF